MTIEPGTRWRRKRDGQEVTIISVAEGYLVSGPCGCDECGYTGKRRRYEWVPFDFNEYQRASDLEHAKDLCNDWNQKHPPGTRVWRWDDDGNPHETVTRSSAWVVGLDPVVKTDDYVGGYLLTPMPPQGEATP